VAITRFVAKKMPFLALEKRYGQHPFVQDHGTAKPADVNSFRETLKIIQAREAEIAAATAG